MRCTSYVVTERIWRAASAPCTDTRPMCETSNTPARVRTASCSAMMPAYWSGISQPAKEAKRAPACR